jgi:hypothetical protein
MSKTAAVRLPTWRAVATRVDLAQSTGPGHAWRRWRRDRALAQLTLGRRWRIARALWAEASAEPGAEVVDLEPPVLEIRRGAAVARVAGQTVALNDPQAVARTADKPRVHETISVKTVTNFNRPCDNESVRGSVSEELCAVAVAAVRAVGLRLAGIDVVAGVVVDLNPIPALHHHLHVANPGSTSRVAVPILRALLDGDRP